MNTPFKPQHIVILAFGLLIGQACQKDEVSIAPKVETIAASDITYATAKLGATIVSNGGSEITSKGICYSTTPSPTVSSDTTNQGGNSNNFEVMLSELLPNTTYYARAYATNKIGTGYGNEISFSTQSGLPTLTLTVSDISYKKMTANWIVTSIGASDINSSGLAFSTSHTLPTTQDDSFTGNGLSVLQDEKILLGLDAGTKYYVRAYAQNSQGIGYSDAVEFTTLTIPATISDIDGNAYPTVLIGDKVWLAADLRVTKYNNGEAIPTTVNATDGEATPKYQWAFNDNDANATTYGRLYTFYAVTDERNVCPAGTHVSTMTDWMELNDVINGGGYKLKSTGTDFWLTPNTAANNETGFNGVGSGYRSTFGGFNNLKEFAFYLTTQTDANNPDDFNGLYLTYNNAQMWLPLLSKKSGYSVRCVVNK